MDSRVSVVLEDLSEGYSAIEAGRFFAGEGIIGMVAYKSLLIESVFFENRKL